MDAEPGQMIEVSPTDIAKSEQSVVNERIHMILENIEGADENGGGVDFLHILRLLIFIAFLVTAMFLSVQAYQVLDFFQMY